MDDEQIDMTRTSRGVSVRITRLADDPLHWPSVEKIFFETAHQKEFSSAAAREAYAARWLGRYLQFDRDNIFLAMTGDGEILGYLAGCLDSRAASDLYREFDFFKTFEPFFESYPAHLHVNVRTGHRNCGIGADLIDAFIGHCRKNGVPGIHVVTGCHARNISFYRRCGFEPIATTKWNERDLVLLGRSVDAKGDQRLRFSSQPS